MLIAIPRNYRPTKGRIDDPIRYLTGKRGDSFPQWNNFARGNFLLDHCETFIDRTTKERIFVSHPYVTDPSRQDEMRAVLDTCGVDVVWFRDSWYYETTWRIELRNAAIRRLVASGECRMVLKQGHRSVLVR